MNTAVMASLAVLFLIKIILSIYQTVILNDIKTIILEAEEEKAEAEAQQAFDEKNIQNNLHERLLNIQQGRYSKDYRFSDRDLSNLRRKY